MNPKYQDLVDVLKETRDYLARPENDFSWSRWKDASEAVAEVDGYIASLNTSQPLNPGFLFMPTASLQEVSLSSGWGVEFLNLASRADAAIEKAFKADPPPPPRSTHAPKPPRP
jgi:hypothetical protein